MRQFNYKCVVAKNGSKMYYKRVNKKWQRISNKVGKNAEKGKRKYMMELPSQYIFTMKKDTPVFKSLKYTREEIVNNTLNKNIMKKETYKNILLKNIFNNNNNNNNNTTLDEIKAKKIENSTLYDDTEPGDPKWFALKNKIYGYGKSNNGFVVWIKIPEKEDIDELNIESYKGKLMDGVCKKYLKSINKRGARSFSYCKKLIPIYYKPEFGCGPFIEVKFHKDLKLINLSDINVYNFLFNLKKEDLEKSIKDYEDNELYLREYLCETFVDCTNNKYKISRKSSYSGDEDVVEELKKFFPEIDGYYYNNKEDKFHPEICVWKWPIKTTTKSLVACKHEIIPSDVIKELNIPTHDKFLKGEFPKNYNSKLYTKKEFKEIKKKRKGETHFILEMGYLGD